MRTINLNDYGNYSGSKKTADELDIEIREFINRDLQTGDIVRFHTPVTPDEITARMIVIENRGPRMIVSDLRFINNSRYPVTPTMNVQARDIIIVKA